MLAGRPWTANVTLSLAFGASSPPAMTILGTWNTFNRVTEPGPCCGNTFATAFADVTATGFQIRLERTDKSGGFGAQMHLRWRACPALSPDGAAAIVSEPGVSHPEGKATVTDAYKVGFCNMVRCPTPGQVFNFGYALRVGVGGSGPTCDKAWPGPLAPAPLVPVPIPGGVLLRSHAVTDDGIHAPVITGNLDVVVLCDPDGDADVATPVNASLIHPNSTTDRTAHFVPHRLVFKSRCACARGCAKQAPAVAAVPTPEPIAPNATMPRDGSFIVRLQHIYGRTEGLGALGRPVTVDLQTAVLCRVGQTITGVREVTITANQRVEDVHHWHWRRKSGQDGQARREPAAGRVDDEANGLRTTIVMAPLTTRTFVVTVA